MVKRAPKYMKQKLAELKGESHGSARAAGDLSAALSVVGRTPRRTDGDVDSNSTDPGRPGVSAERSTRQPQKRRSPHGHTGLSPGWTLARPQNQSQQVSKD